MALSNAEHQRRYRERQKGGAKEATAVLPVLEAQNAALAADNADLKSKIAQLEKKVLAEAIARLAAETTVELLQNQIRDIDEDARIESQQAEADRRAKLEAVKVRARARKAEVATVKSIKDHVQDLQTRALFDRLKKDKEADWENYRRLGSREWSRQWSRQRAKEQYDEQQRLKETAAGVVLEGVGPADVADDRPRIAVP